MGVHHRKTGGISFCEKNSNNGQNPGNADKLGVPGIVLCPLAQII